MTFATAPSGVPLVKNGQARAIGVSGTARIPALPDVATIQETVPGYVVNGWNGLVGPAQMPAPVLEKIHAGVTAIMRRPDIRDKLIGLGADPFLSSPREFEDLMKSDLVKWAKVVKDSGAKLD